MIVTLYIVSNGHISLNLQEWKSTLLGVIITFRDHFVFVWKPTLKIVESTTLEQGRSYGGGGGGCQVKF